MLGLYVHIPFCSAICNYCNFNRGLFDARLKDRYISALEREIRSSDPGEAADTIFFGGGTPSLLEPQEIARLITACRETFDLAADAEVTLETNPETSSAERMEQFRAAGVNRVSFGVQAFRDEELARLGRIHSASRARAAIAEAQAAGIDNISLDLMMWLPQQTRDDWAGNVEALIELGPQHASLYLLELYPNAPLKEDMARAGWSLAPDDDAADMYLHAMERLESAGYVQYEISNVSLPDRESRHNLKYWQDGEWLGFGCGAHSTRRIADPLSLIGADPGSRIPDQGSGDEGSGIQGSRIRDQGSMIRWKNIASTSEYIQRLEVGTPVDTEKRILSARERLEEALFTGLRLTAGVDLDEMSARYGVNVWDRYWERLAPFADAGRLVREGARVRLTRDGMLVANEILQVFV